MKLFIRTLLFVFVALVTNVKVISATITFPKIQETRTSFSCHNEIPKSVFNAIENDIVNCCQNGNDLVAYRSWAISAARNAAKGGANLSTNGVKLAKQLASESQMGEKGITVIGPGNLREAGRLAQQYGGKAPDWVKKSSSSFTKNGTTFETHWYENISTGVRAEFKTKFP